MKRKCLYCYKEVDSSTEFHPKCSMKFFGTKTPPSLSYSLDEMNELAKTVVERSISVPGVQPKLSMSLLREAKKNPENRLTIVGTLGGNYIFKPPTDQFPEMPQNEHLTMRMAEMFGLKTVLSSLIKLKSGELSYITKRIDRTDVGDKIHMLDMFQITEAFDKYKSSMEKMGKALEKYSANTLLDKLFFFELTVFSFLTGNNDMHLKNFSMIKSNSGWVLAPGYDLLNVTILNPEDTEELALPMEGKKKKLKREHFERFGEKLGLTPKQVKGVFTRFFKAKDAAVDLIEISFLSGKMKKSYLTILNSRFSDLN